MQVNPAERFAAELSRQGFVDNSPTADGQATIERFADLRAAEGAPEVEPSAPNEFDLYEPARQEATALCADEGSPRRWKVAFNAVAEFRRGDDQDTVNGLSADEVAAVVRGQAAHLQEAAWKVRAAPRATSAEGVAHTSETFAAQPSTGIPSLGPEAAGGNDSPKDEIRSKLDAGTREAATGAFRDRRSPLTARAVPQYG